MPYCEVPGRGLNMFYTINPEHPLGLSMLTPHHGEEPPPGRPLLPGLPIVVFLHAGCNTSASFTLQLTDPRLSKGFNLVALDARCHGLTRGEPRETYEISDAADCAIAVLDKLRFPSYHLFCEGVMGCGTGVWITIRRSEKVQSLVLASPGWPIESDAVAESLVALLEWACSNKDGQGDGTGRIPSDAMVAIGDYFFGNLARLQAQREEHAEFIELRYGRGWTRHDFAHILGQGARKRIPIELTSQIKIPILIVHGSEDNVVSPDAAVEEWKESFPSARGGAVIHHIKGAPHLLSFTDANVVNRLLLRFVEDAIASQPKRLT